MPRIIWLTKHCDDPDFVVCQKHQPGVGFAYIRVDLVQSLADVAYIDIMNHVLSGLGHKKEKKDKK